MVCRLFYENSRDEQLWELICQTQPNCKENLEFKPDNCTFRWLARATLNIFREKDGPKNGCGTFQSKSGSNKQQYFGDMVDNKKHGYGILRYPPTKAVYYGGFKNDCRDGKGIRIWPNGNKYQGEYKENKRDGEGKFEFFNRSIFQGTFRDNKFIKGQYDWPNGRQYQGEWQCTERHGHGKYIWPSKVCYIGSWEKDKRKGRGMMIWPNGDKFDGHFEDSKRKGRGIFRAINGKSYIQNWDEQIFDEKNKGDMTEEFIPGSQSLKTPVYYNNNKPTTNQDEISTSKDEDSNIELPSNQNQNPKKRSLQEEIIPSKKQKK